MDWQELKHRISSPALIAEKDPYLIKIADTPEEVLETQKLRFRVFNQEQGKGLTAAEADGIDRDEYDNTSLHLVVREKNLNIPVGTYRIILGLWCSIVLTITSSPACISCWQKEEATRLMASVVPRVKTISCALSASMKRRTVSRLCSSMSVATTER